MTANHAPELLGQTVVVIGASIAAFDATDFDRLGRFFDELPTPIDHVLVTGPGPYYAPLAEFDVDKARRDVDAHLLLPLLVARDAASKVRRCRPDSLAVLVAASVWFLGARGAVAQGSAEPASLHWLVPPVLPPGALIAVVSGDPTGPGESTLQLSMPNGYRIPPHSHPSDEHVEVREGTLLVGMGDLLDPKLTRALAAGDSATAPAGMHHFSIAKGRTVLSVTFIGPYTITYVRAEDAPRPQIFPFGY